MHVPKLSPLSLQERVAEADDFKEPSAGWHDAAM
jgi:hypothetical protein